MVLLWLNRIMLEKIPKIKLIDGIFILGFLLIVVGIGMNFREQFWEKSEVKIDSKKISPTGIIEVKSDNKVVIDIEGEVIKPGLYELEGEVRINNVLEVAGGLSAKADREWIKKNLNLADRVVDGQKIYIPRVGEVKEISSKLVLGSSDKKGKISLNQASLEELDKLSGIGPALGGRIISYRKKNGGFKNIEELKLVSGIGDKLFEKIKDDISL